jgi:hypothetical protein
MKRLREQPLDDTGNFKRSPLQYGLKASGLTPMRNLRSAGAMRSKRASTGRKMRRFAGARDGVKRPVVYMGQVVGYVQEYSDSLLKFLLEAKRPAVYRGRNINVMAPDGNDGVLEVRWKEPESQGPHETPH